LSEILKLNDSEFSELKNEIESHLMNLENDWRKIKLGACKMSKRYIDKALVDNDAELLNESIQTYMLASNTLYQDLLTIIQYIHEEKKRREKNADIKS
jgi:sugar-specific transcriptional regulator TrmB